MSTLPHPQVFTRDAASTDRPWGRPDQTRAPDRGIGIPQVIDSAWWARRESNPAATLDEPGHAKSRNAINLSVAQHKISSRAAQLPMAQALRQPSYPALLDREGSSRLKVDGKNINVRSSSEPRLFGCRVHFPRVDWIHWITCAVRAAPSARSRQRTCPPGISARCRTSGTGNWRQRRNSETGRSNWGRWTGSPIPW
jgi:hypothetical protein